MSLTQDLENYVTTKGYYTSEQLVNMQFEIGERAETWDDLYHTILEDKVIEMEGSLIHFNASRDNRVLDELEQINNDWPEEYLREIGD